jgi:tRNA ligase
MDPTVRLMALNWSLDRPHAMIHRICSDRVLERGKNHQKLLADAHTKMHEDVISQFINTTEELASAEVDAIIEMDLTESLEDAVEHAVNGCVDVLRVKKPSREQIGVALAVARTYSPQTKGKASPKDKAKAPPRYFGLQAEVDLVSVLGPLLAVDNAPVHVKKLWASLVEDKRVARQPHVTITHEKQLPQELDLWERCTAIHHLPTPPLFRLKLKHIVCNGRAMAVVVEDLELDDSEEEDRQHGQEFISMLPEGVGQRLHITVGTLNSNIAPVEAKTMVEEWREGKGGPQTVSIPLQGITAKGRIKGLSW